MIHAWKFPISCYLLLQFQVINDLLDPTGQNLRVREDAQVYINTWVLSFLHIFFLPFLVLCHSLKKIFRFLKIKFF